MGWEQSGNLTELLAQFRRGEPGAEAKLVTLVYDELHRLAVHHMRRERKEHSLQPTALVHEAYLRLVTQRPKSWKNRAHFFAVAAMLMRQILVDHARRRLAVKRGTGKANVSLDDPATGLASQLALDPDQCEDLVALDEALTTLSKVNPRQSRIIELRFFSGMSTQEIAEVLGISERTVEREAAAAQAELYAMLRPLA